MFYSNYRGIICLDCVNTLSHILSIVLNTKREVDDSSRHYLIICDKIFIVKFFFYDKIINKNIKGESLSTLVRPTLDKESTHSKICT